MDEEKRKRMAQADRAAGTMFNVFPQGAFSGISSAIQKAQGEPMMADSGSLNLSAIPIFPKMGPLVRTNYGSPPSERPDFRDPAKQWDARPVTPYSPATVGSGRTISTADAIAQNNANMTDDQRRAYGLLSLSPSSAGVAMGAYQGAPTGIAGGVAPTTFSPSFDQGIASSRFGIAQSPNQTPMAPVSTNIAGATERRGVQTAYGMIYPAAGQEAGAERSAALGPMGARLANVGQDLSQQDRIAQMRERGAALAQQRIGSQEAFFTQKRAERDAFGTAESAARTAGARPMDIMRAREAASGPSTIGGIQREFASYQPAIGPMAPTSLYASNAASRFTEALPAGGIRPLPSGPMGPSGMALYEQQQAEKIRSGIAGPFSNVNAEQRQRSRRVAQARGTRPVNGRSIQGAQEDYFNQGVQEDYFNQGVQEDYFNRQNMF